jgi:hypothetical protein
MIYIMVEVSSFLQKSTKIRHQAWFGGESNIIVSFSKNLNKDGMAGFEAKFHRSWQGGAVLKTATADKLKMRNEEIMKPLILKQGSLNFAEKPVMSCSLGETKLLQSNSCL